jgi:CBS domain containing-hemolysin-like protein
MGFLLVPRARLWSSLLCIYWVSPPPFDLSIFKYHLHLAPIAWPIAKLLDYVLGIHDAHTYKKAELKSFLQFHRTGEEPLRDDEISILNGVLELNTKNVEKIMTPMQVVFFALSL